MEELKTATTGMLKERVKLITGLVTVLVYFILSMLGNAALISITSLVIIKVVVAIMFAVQVYCIIEYTREKVRLIKMVNKAIQLGRLVEEFTIEQETSKEKV
jgi:hypothetical protein